MAAKVSKATAKYRDTPNGDERCQGCSMFREPDNCTAVEGVISPRGWCRYWERSTAMAASDTAAAIKDAVKATERNPTPEEAEAGNYKKGKFPWNSLTVALETPKGALRTGVDKNGKKWSVRQPAHYGYFLKSEARDGDHVDVYVGDAHDSQKVWIIDQVDAATGKYDEPKAFIDFPSKDAAMMTYGQAFSDGKAKDRLGAITEMSVDKFVDWVKSGDTKKPLGLRQRFAEGGAVMPLIKSGAKGAVSHNIKAEMAAGKPQRQAVAIALETARRYAKRAFGGRVGYAEGGWAGERDSLPPPEPSVLAERPRSPVPDYLLGQQRDRLTGTDIDGPYTPTRIGPPAGFGDLMLRELKGNASFPAEMTGIPSALRSADAYAAGDMPTAVGEGVGAVAPFAGKALAAIPKSVAVPAIAGLAGTVLGSDTQATTTPAESRNAEIRKLEADIARLQEAAVKKQLEVGAAKFRGVGEEAGMARQKAMEEVAKPFADAMANARERIAQLRAQNDEEQNFLVRAERDADRARREELARGKPFNQTPVGEVWERAGPLAPAAVGLGTALAGRLGHGPKAGLMKPALEGLGAGALSANIPTGWDAFFSPIANPSRKAYQTYGEELKVAQHPRSQEWLDYAKTLPEINPVREAAQKEFFDPWKAGERMAFGAGEGLAGAGLGLAGAVGLERLGRGVKSLFGSRPGKTIEDLTLVPSREAAGLPGSAGTAVGELGPPGVAPQSRMLPSPNQSAMPLEARSLPEPSRLAERLPEYRKAVGQPLKPEAAPSSPAPKSSSPAPSSPDWSGPPPQGVILKKNELWDKNVQQVRVVKPGEGARFAKTRFSAKSLTQGKAPSKKSKGNEPATEKEVAPGVPYKEPKPPGGDFGFAHGGAIGAALETARHYAKYARGGVVVGAVKGATGGRADAIPVSVPAGSFVIPSDCVSGMPSAGNNTEAGMAELEKMFGKPQVSKRADGGAVPIQISHGEFVLGPEQVARVGHGDIEKGHRTLEAFVKQIRAQNLKAIAGLPPPAR